MLSGCIICTMIKDYWRWFGDGSLRMAIRVMITVLDHIYQHHDRRRHPATRLNVTQSGAFEMSHPPYQTPTLISLLRLRRARIERKGGETI